MPTVLMKTAHRCPSSSLVRWRCGFIHNADIGWMPGCFRRSKEVLRGFSRSRVFGSVPAGGSLRANDGTFYELCTVRKIGVIRSTANQDSDGFLFSPLGSNMHKKTLCRRWICNERDNISLSDVPDATRAELFSSSAPTGLYSVNSIVFSPIPACLSASIAWSAWARSRKTPTMFEYFAVSVPILSIVSIGNSFLSHLI